MFAISLLACAAGALGDATAQQPAKIADTIEQRMAACAICHGKQGEGIRKNEYYPRLAGKPAVYLYNQLLNFRERRRDIPIMTYMVAYLSEPYLREIADYYAGLRPPFPPPATAAPKEVLARGEKLVTAGDPAREIPACAACHGKALTGLEPAVPGAGGAQSRLHCSADGKLAAGLAKRRVAGLHGGDRETAHRGGHFRGHLVARGAARVARHAAGAGRRADAADEMRRRAVTADKEGQA